MIVVIEGLDGAGTTTQSKLLTKKLNHLGYKTDISREPTSGAIGSVIRQYLSGELKSPKLDNMPFLTYLFVADRESHISSLDSSNDIFVFDRYFLSNMVYQSEEISFDNCYELNKHFPKPDLTIVLDTSVDKCISRITSREIQDIFENEQFLTAARQRYHDAANYLKSVANHNIVFYNPEQKNIEAVAEDIYKIVFESLKLDTLNLSFPVSKLRELSSISGINYVLKNSSWVSPNVPSDVRENGWINLSDRATFLICADIVSKKTNMSLGQLVDGGKKNLLNIIEELSRR